MKNYEAHEPCTVCRLEGEGMVCFHHLFTKRVYPEFAECIWNLIPVCKRHHNEFHDNGTTHMAEKYLPVHLWLLKNDWFFDDYVEKWRRRGF